MESFLVWTTHCLDKLMAALVNFFTTAGGVDIDLITLTWLKVMVLAVPSLMLWSIRNEDWRSLVIWLALGALEVIDILFSCALQAPAIFWTVVKLPYYLVDRCDLWYETFMYDSIPRALWYSHINEFDCTRNDVPPGTRCTGSIGSHRPCRWEKVLKTNGDLPEGLTGYTASFCDTHGHWQTASQTLGSCAECEAAEAQSHNHGCTEQDTMVEGRTGIKDD